MNYQPITKLLDDPMDLEALNPNRILLLKGKPSLSPGLFDVHDVHKKKVETGSIYMEEMGERTPTFAAGEAEIEQN